MSVLTRSVLLVLTIVSSLIAVGIAVMIWTGTTWDMGGSETLRMQLGVQGTDAMRMRFALIAAAIGVLIAALGLVGTFVQPHMITLWLGRQHGIRVPADVM